jgi:serine/threonine protein kinase
VCAEFCGGGSVDSYLRKNGHLLSQLQRLSMMVAAARGVKHLHSQSIVHRDLAVRNFLLTRWVMRCDGHVYVCVGMLMCVIAVRAV